MTVPEKGLHSPRFLLLLAWLCYAGFLVWPGFSSSVVGDDTRDFNLGYESVSTGFFYFPYVAQDILSGQFDYAALIPFSLANLAFVALPVLHCMGQSRRLRLNQTLHWVFLAGAAGVVVWLWQSYFDPPDWPAYLWLAAIALAVAYLRQARKCAPPAAAAVGRVCPSAPVDPACSIR